MTKAYLHMDLDAFFASVELLDHPEWKGLPVIVGGKPEDRRSVVSTASYEARKYGVHSAMPTVNAAKLCPEGIFVHPRMDRYLELSEKVMAIFSRYSPDVQQLSIDEAFIDLTGTEKLFGNPQETALKIKQQVFEETGLTISAGLATTKYLAKIASEVNKPNGFYQIDEGQEEAFMLNLPLNKVWGIGAKTLEALKSKGITTTKSIHEKSLSLLCALFGECTGNFLYNAVRGQEKETFSHSPKTHSISAENTYSWDLTHTDSIDTALLELCHTIMWRLHRENKRSSCVFVKIRYDDFTTVSIQETSCRPVSNLDDLYQRVKNLFYKKYTPNHGIRLLGCGFNNVVSSSEPFQGELFDFGNEKKRRLEEAVFNTESKLKGVKITKARLLNNAKNLVYLAAMFISGAAASAKLNCETPVDTERTADGAGAIVFDSSKLPPSMTSEGSSLFSYSVFDQNVEFRTEGWWKTMVSNTWKTTFGFGSTPGFSSGSPVLASEVDLTLWFLLNNHWYFEASFAEEFETNTVAAGYYGDGVLKEARIANRQIVFPSCYSVDDFGKGIGGGKNHSPGISFNFEGNTWKADAAVRYDNIELHSKTWYGKNSVSKQTFAPDSFVAGRHFVLPSAGAVTAVKAVYVESSDGSFKDSSGRKFKKLDSSQYLLSAPSCSVYISDSARTSARSGILPAIALELENDYDLISELGTTGTKDSPGTLFLGNTQRCFNVNLKDYLLPLSGTLNGEKIYYVQYPSKFSPYAVLNRYDAGLKCDGEASVISTSTEVNSSTLLAVLTKDDENLVSGDFMKSEHIYAEVYTEGSFTMLDAEYRFPFASTAPGVYLGWSTGTDLAVCVKTFSPVSRLEIGTKAVPGTVTVYKNGIEDNAATFDNESGCIYLSTAVNSSDRITAKWYEDSSDSTTGTVSAAAGFKKDFSENLNADISTSVKWSWRPQDLKNEGKTSAPGFVTLATGLEYQNYGLTVKNSAAVTAETPDTNGKLTISSMDEEKTETVYLAKESGIDLPSDIYPVLNIKDESPLYLSKKMNGSVSAASGTTDSEISGYKIPVSWDFDSSLEPQATDTDPFWSALSIKMSGNSYILPSCKAFSLALKADDILVTDYDLYLQLGVKADKNLTFEDSALIPCWKLTESSSLVKTAFDPAKSGWQIVTVIIPDQYSSLLKNNYDGRLVVTSKKAIIGTIWAGPYEPSQQQFTVTSQKDSTVFASQQRISGSNWAQAFEFKNSDEDTFTIERYYAETDLENWKYLVLNLKYLSSSALSDKDSMEITLDRPAQNDSFETAIRLNLDWKDLQQLSDCAEFTDLKINLYDKKSSAGKIEKINTQKAPVRLQIVLKTHDKSSLYLNELFLEESTLDFIIQDKINARYEKKGNVVCSDKTVFVKDLKLITQAQGQTSLKAEKPSDSSNAFTGKAEAYATVTGFNLEGSAGRSSSSTIPVSQASHLLKTEKPLFNLLSVSESYDFNHDEESLEKNNYLRVDLNRFNLPVVLNSEVSSTSDSWALSQKANAGLSAKTRHFTLDTKTKASQKIKPSLKGISTLETTNYAKSWKDITKFAFDTGSEYAASRTTALESLIQYSISYLSLKPSVFFASENNYKNNGTAVNSDTTQLQFSIPFKVVNNSFNLSWKKETGGILQATASGSYKKDIEHNAEQLSRRDWYFKALPVADLFDSKLSHSVLKDSSQDHSETESLYYSSLYSLQWKRPLLSTNTDFYLPSGALLGLQRDIKASSTTADIYQVKGQFNWNAYNVFGSKSQWNLTDLFEQDEYTTSLTAAFKIPKNSGSDLTMIISFYQQSIFYMQDKSSFKTGIEFIYEDKNNLSSKATMVYKRPSTFSPVADCIKYFFNDFKALEISRSDSVNLSLNRSTSTSSADETVFVNYNLDYSHTVDVKITSFAELNVSAGLSYDCSWNQLVTLGATAGIGATFKF